MHRLLSVLSGIMVFGVEVVVRFYQACLSPLLIGTCKFHPSCSEYFVQAVREWGVIRGGWMGVRRILRCRPGVMGGIDFVPRKNASR